MTPSTPFITRLSHSLISIALIILFMYLAQSILVPMAFASLFCILLMVPCDYMEKRRIPKGIAALISLLMAITIVFVIFYFISSQLAGFRNDLPKLGQQLFDGINDLQLWVERKLNVEADTMKSYLDSATSETLSHTSSLVGSTVSTLSTTLIYIVLIPIYTFLLLLYRKMIVHFFVRSFSEEDSPIVYGILRKTKTVIKGYVVGLCIEMVIVAMLNWIGFMMLGVKYALLLAIIGAILNLIPYLGIFTACIISVLITFTTNSPATVTGVAITLLIVHLIDSNILLPKVVGSKVKINALVTILGVLFGHALWGFSGMFLAIPIIAILKVVFDSIEHLTPWGFILGDEVVVTNAPKKLMNFKRKSVKLKMNDKK